MFHAKLCFLVMISTAVIFGDVKAFGESRKDRRLNLSGEWVGSWQFGKDAKSVVAIEFGVAEKVCWANDLFIAQFIRNMVDEGSGQCRSSEYLGIYTYSGDRLIISFRHKKGGRPKQFKAGDGQDLLILRRVKDRGEK